MSLPKVLLVDQSNIAASLDCVSLFVNGEHVMDSDYHTNALMKGIADSIAKALSTSVVTMEISENELAKSIATKQGNLEQLNADLQGDDCDLDDWVQGYTNDDLIEALMRREGDCNKYPYTVLGFYEESAQIFSHHTESTSALAAFSEVSKLHDDAVFVSVLEGHINEGEGIEFPGSALVDAETVLAQPAVFGGAASLPAEEVVAG